MTDISRFTRDEFNMILERDLQLRFKDWFKLLNNPRATEKTFLQQLIKSTEIRLQNSENEIDDLLNTAAVSLVFNRDNILRMQIEIAIKRLENIPPGSTSLDYATFVSETNDIRFKKWFKDLHTNFLSEEIFLSTEISLCKAYLEKNKEFDLNYYHPTLLAILQSEYYTLLATQNGAESFKLSQNALYQAIEQEKTNEAQAPLFKNEQKPAFKPEATQTIFNLLKGFFSHEHQKEFERILKNGDDASEPLIFRDNGNRLADAFKQLIKADIITGCNQRELEEWISVNFKYRFRQSIKPYKLRYLNDIISSNKDLCQKPILKITNGIINKI